MKSTIAIAAAALLSTLAAGPANAADAAKAEALAKQYNCLSCHMIDKKLVGPAYKEVAKKYKGNADAVAMLTKSVTTGSKDKWGPIPMPPNDKVPAADVKTLVEWVLSM